MFTRKMLSDEERAEYDAMFEAACYDAAGSFRSTREAAPILLGSIKDAIQAHRVWASYLHDSFVMIGYQAAVRRWQNEQKKHKTLIDGKFVSRRMQSDSPRLLKAVGRHSRRHSLRTRPLKIYKS